MDNDQDLETRLNALAGAAERSESNAGVDGELEGDGELSVGGDLGDGRSIMDDPSVMQHIVRSESGGLEALSGLFRMSFSPQQTSTVLHVPLHPPMGGVPEVETFCDLESFRIRVTDSQRFGVRLEIKTPPLDSKVSGVIHVEIKSIQGNVSK